MKKKYCEDCIYYIGFYRCSKIKDYKVSYIEPDNYISKEYSETRAIKCDPHVDNKNGDCKYYSGNKIDIFLVFLLFVLMIIVLIVLPTVVIKILQYIP